MKLTKKTYPKFALKGQNMPFLKPFEFCEKLFF